MSNLTVPNLKPSKNHIINGYFDVWQRGDSFAYGSGARYTSDRWNAGNLLQVDKYQLTEAQQEALNLEQITNAIKITVDDTALAEDKIYTRIEGVNTLAGKKAILSFLKWCGVNAYLNKLKIKQNFGTGGSAEVVTTLLSYPTDFFTTSPTKTMLEVNIPSIAGKTIGADSYLEIEFTLGIRAGYTDTFYFTAFELYEAGKQAPERKTYNNEYQECLRYFEVIEFGATQDTDNNFIPFHKKRVIPTVTDNDTDHSPVYQFLRTTSLTMDRVFGDIEYDIYVEAEL